MSTSAFQYEYIEDVETLEYYKPGGYHPIHIDDRLHNRYRIVHKLGHGTFSTAWLAVDELTSKYVAVKVCIADVDKREVDILSELSIPATTDLRDKYNKTSTIPKILDRFNIEGPNGTHPCLVTLPARCSLRESKEASDNCRQFQLNVARSLAAQLTLAVSFVHSRGYAHGDLHLGNVLLKLSSSLNNLSVSELYTEFGEPDPQPIVRLKDQTQPAASSSPTSEAGVPSHAIPSIWLGILSDELPLNEAQLLLTDFGTAFRPSEKSRFQSYTPLVIRPPEAYFEPTTPLSFPSDMWSLGCIIFEILAHRSLIEGTLATQDYITAQQVNLQGRLPDEWWGKFENREKWFDEDGTSRMEESDVWGWDKKFDQHVQESWAYRGMEVMCQEEKEALLEMLQWMLKWRPSERPSADQVLETAWMRKWALPAYEEGRKGWE